MLGTQIFVLSHYLNFVASILIAMQFVGCKKMVEQKSRLQVFSGEGAFAAEVCDKKLGVTRYSQIQIGGRTIAMVSPNYCVNRNRVLSKGSKSGGFSLSDSRSQRQPGAKPVLVHYGYAGNSSRDELINRGGRQILDWAQNAGYRVLDVSGKDLGDAQNVIMNDRKQHPGDYQDGGHITFNVDAHGGTDENGIHRIYASSDFKNGRSKSNLRTTDVLGAFLSAAGSGVGTVVCNVQSCKGSDAINDPKFERLKTNPANAQQMRAFHFGAGPGVSAVTPFGNKAANGEWAGIEQASLLMLQNADPERGLTVGKFREIEQKTNLTLTKPDVRTYFVPMGPGVISDTGTFNGGTVSHQGVRYFDNGPQNPTIVGPSEAYLIPPGVSSIKGFSPVVGREGVSTKIGQLPPIQGGILRESDELEKWPSDQ